MLVLEPSSPRTAAAGDPPRRPLRARNPTCFPPAVSRDPAGLAAYPLRRSSDQTDRESSTTDCRNTNPCGLLSCEWARKPPPELVLLVLPVGYLERRGPARLRRRRSHGHHTNGSQPPARPRWPRRAR